MLRKFRGKDNSKPAKHNKSDYSKHNEHLKEKLKHSNSCQFDREFREECAYLETLGLNLIKLGRELARKQKILSDKNESIEEEKNSAIHSFEKLILRVLNISESLNIETVKNQSEEAPSQILEYVQNRLLEAIKRDEVTDMNLKTGDIYDPEISEAEAESVNNDVKPGTILKILSPGYFHRSNILRKAKVEISKKGDIIEQ